MRVAKNPVPTGYAWRWLGAGGLRDSARDHDRPLARQCLLPRQIMRIAYIAPYQGQALLQRRPIVRNLSLGGKAKIELFAELLQSRSHTVEIVSQGEVIERGARYYPGFVEPNSFSGDIPVFYSSALPIRFLNGLWSSESMLRVFRSRNRLVPYDLVLIYNLKPAQVACARYAVRRNIPVVLQYEDDHFMDVGEPGGSRYTEGLQRNAARQVLRAISGCVANSPSLLAQAPEHASKLLLSGVIGEGIRQAAEARTSPRQNWVVFSGTHTKAQGLEQLIAAWRIAALPGWELHIAGHGDMTRTLQRLAEGDPTITFHGILDRHRNAQLLTGGRLSVVPFEVRETQGFSFKTIECLGAGLHVITTRLTAFDGMAPQLKAGITFIDDNRPETIAAALKEVVAQRRYERDVAKAALDVYGHDAVARSLDAFMTDVAHANGRSVH
jgi:hypothetical protein